MLLGGTVVFKTGVTRTKIFEVITCLSFEKGARWEMNCQEATAMISCQK